MVVVVVGDTIKNVDMTGKRTLSMSFMKIEALSVKKLDTYPRGILPNGRSVFSL